MDSALKSVEKFFGLDEPKKRSTRRNSKSLPVAPVIIPDESLPVAKVVIPAPSRVPAQVLYALAKNPNLLPNRARLGKVNSTKFRKLVAKLKKEKPRSSRRSSLGPSPLRQVIILPNAATSLGPNNYTNIGHFGPIPNNFNGNRSPTIDELIQEFKNFEKTRSKKR
jgi:hypothetical protein